MSERPEITVVLPTRNRPGPLLRAIESVRRQTFNGWQLIIVDDASRPAAASGLGTDLLREPRARLIRLEVRVGAAVARNRGIEEAEGGLLAFLDDDDEWDPQFLETMLAALNSSPEADVAYCGLRSRDGTGGPYVPPLPDLTGRSDPLSVLVRGNFIGTPCVLLRRDAIQAVGGFDPELPRLQDWDLWLRMATGSGFVQVPAPLVSVGTGEARISTSDDRLLRACTRLAERRPEELALTRRMRGDFLYTLATLLALNGLGRRARPFYMRALRSRPGPPRRILGAAAAMFAPAWFVAVTRWLERIQRRGARRNERPTPRSRERSS